MVPNEKVFARFTGGGNDHQLTAAAQDLLAHQRDAWPACSKGFAALEQAEVRTLNVSGLSARLQWNPQRIVSTAAKVDAASIQARRCFLCVEHLPVEQQGILYDNDYLILCNPSPIFPAHYTITHVEHRPQRILDGIDTFIAVSGDMGDGYVTFYNGPKCGASAPDHLHFQAVSGGFIPAEANVKEAAKKDRLTERNGVSIWKIPFYGRTHCVLTGTDPGALAGVFADVLGAWARIVGTDEEPMLNLLSIVDGNARSLLLFLRSKHRPDDYFKEAEDQVLVSPASVDMGGHIVTPVEKDFHSIDGPYIERMYTEVSAPPNLVSDIIHAL